MPIERLAAGPLYLQLKSILQRQIDTGELQPGDMLPSLRELCRQYEVSSITVRRALQELVNEGRLQSQQGIGTFVTTRNRRPRLALVILGFIEREWRRNSGIFGDLIAGAATVAWEREALFSVTRVDPERDVAGFLASIVAERFFDGLLVRVLSDAHPADLQPVREAGLPYVVIKRYTPGVPTNCVVVDDVRAACEATSHLLAHGCRRIAFVCPQGTIVGRDRHEGYRRAPSTAFPTSPSWCRPWPTGSKSAAMRLSRRSWRCRSPRRPSSPLATCSPSAPTAPPPSWACASRRTWPWWAMTTSRPRPPCSRR